MGEEVGSGQRGSAPIKLADKVKTLEREVRKLERGGAYDPQRQDGTVPRDLVNRLLSSPKGLRASAKQTLDVRLQLCRNVGAARLRRLRHRYLMLGRS